MVGVRGTLGGRADTGEEGTEWGPGDGADPTGPTGTPTPAQHTKTIHTQQTNILTNAALQQSSRNLLDVTLLNNYYVQETLRSVPAETVDAPGAANGDGGADGGRDPRPDLTTGTDAAGAGGSRAEGGTGAGATASAPPSPVSTPAVGA